MKRKSFSSFVDRICAVTFSFDGDYYFRFSWTHGKHGTTLHGLYDWDKEFGGRLIMSGLVYEVVHCRL